MTDSYLMDANCIHGEVWYECQECEKEEQHNDRVWGAFNWIYCRSCEGAHHKDYHKKSPLNG